MPGERKEAVRATEADCPNFINHTPCPSGYNQWHEWARKMGRGYKQERCSGCGLFAIWVPRRPLPESDSE